MVFGWLKASAIGSRRSPWIPVPASPLIHPPSWLSDRASVMHSQNLLFGIVALCLCLMLLPCMVYAIPLHQFYRYGIRAGDAVLQRNDDGVSPPIPLGSSGFRYYHNLHSSIFVSLVSTCNRLRVESLKYCLWLLIDTGIVYAGQQQWANILWWRHAWLYTQAISSEWKPTISCCVLGWRRYQTI